MRRIAFAWICLTLSGCGFNTWSNMPFTSGTNPNRPVGDSENMRRVTGEQVEVPALTPEPGDVWPGPIQPPPTLEDIEKQGVQPQVEQPVPGSPLSQNPPPNLPAPATRGSSTPPGSTQPGLAPLPTPRSPSPSINTAPPGPNAGGQVIQTPRGPAVTSGGSTGYQTLTTPGGGSAIVVPNGNGTSTIIHSDGKIETVPTAR